MNKQLKLDWCDLIEKKLSDIIDMKLNKKANMIAVIRSSPCIEFYRVTEGRLVLIQRNILKQEE